MKKHGDNYQSHPHKLSGKKPTEKEEKSFSIFFFHSSIPFHHFFHVI